MSHDYVAYNLVSIQTQEVCVPQVV